MPAILQGRGAPVRLVSGGVSASFFSTTVVGLHVTTLAAVVAALLAR